MTSSRSSVAMWRIPVGLIPLWILLVLLIGVPHLGEAIGANPPAVVGLPLGVVLVRAALALMVVGIQALRRASSERSALVAFIGLTLPSAIIVALAPLFVLLIQSMPLY
jgi:hypothetical protein